MTKLHTATPDSPLELRDRLAMERTRLANERTLLAYLRTGLTLVIAGLTFFKFFRSSAYVWAGVLFIPLGLAIVVLGWRRYQVRARHIEQFVAAADAMV